MSRDSILLDRIQSDFPVEERPFRALGAMLELSEDETLDLIADLIDNGLIRQIGPFFDSKRLGFRSTLVAAMVEPGSVDEVALYINLFKEVTHNYLRAHLCNLWFTLIAEEDSRIEEILNLVRARKGVRALHNLPARKMYKINVDFSITGKAKRRRAEVIRDGAIPDLKDREKKLIHAIQNGIPIEKKPYESIAASLGEEESWIIDTIREWMEKGVIRRFGAALRHHRAGFCHNAMVVWSVPADDEDRTGRIFAGNDNVSHCYTRPVFPGFPWNLYTMIHSQTKDGLLKILAEMREKSAIESFLMIESMKEYKKSSPRYF